MTPDSLFRKNVLQKLYSPDQLDQLLRITSPRSWFMLLGLFILLLTFILWGFFGTINTRVAAQGIILSQKLHGVSAGQSGRLAELLVEPDDTVKIGQPLALIEPKDGEAQDTLRSMQEGLVVQVNAALGQALKPETTVLQVEALGMEFAVRRAALFVPLQDGKKVQKGMSVEIAPATVEPEEHGYIEGKVVHVSELPVTKESLMNRLHNDLLVAHYDAEGAPFEVEVELIGDPSSPNGYKWTSERGPDVRIGNGTPVNARVLVATQRPVDLVIPGLVKQ